MATADLVIAFDARIGNLESALKRTETALKSTERQAKETGGTLATSLETGASRASAALTSAARSLLAFGVAALAFDRISSVITGVIQKMDELTDSAQQVGVSAVELNNLQIAFRDAGGQASDAASALGKLNDRIGDAVRGSAEANNSFAALGIAYRNTDGSVRSTAEVFDDLAEKMRNATSQQERMSIATEFFGRGAARAAVVAVEALEAGLARSNSMLERFGIALGTETADKIGKVTEAFDRLGDVISTSIANAIAFVSPLIVAFLEFVTQAVAATIRTIGNIVGGIQAIFGRLGEALGITVATPLQLAQREVATLDDRLQTTLRNATRAQIALSQSEAEPGSYANLRAQREVELLNRQADAENERLIAARRRLRELTPPAETIPIPPTPQIPTTITSGGGASRAIDEMARAAQRLYDATRSPLEQFRISAEAALGVWDSGKVTAALGGFDTISRAVSEYAVTSFNGLTQAGATSEQAQAKVLAALTAIGAGLQVGSEAWNRWSEVVRAAQGAVAAASQTTQTELERVSGASAKQVDAAFQNVISSVALEGATLEQAWDKLLKSILKTVIDFVYQMTVQAAILRLLKSAFSGFGGAIQSVGPIVPGETRAFAGIPYGEGGDGGGISAFGLGASLSGGGSALGRGLVVPTPEPASGDLIVNVNNLSSNTTMRRQERNNGLGGKEVDIYIEDLVRRGINDGRFDGVMSQSFGASRRGRV